jgi:hypothetical protein
MLIFHAKSTFVQTENFEMMFLPSIIHWRADFGVNQTMAGN